MTHYTRQEVIDTLNMLKGSSLADDYPGFVKFLEDVWNGKKAVFNATNREGVGLYSKAAVLALLERIEKEVIGEDDEVGMYTNPETITILKSHNALRNSQRYELSTIKQEIQE